MDYLLVGLTSFLIATLTFFSGFGLGTLLMPVLALFFPLESAVGATAIVHLANNFLKVGLLGKQALWPVVVRFGLPAIPAAFFGAYLLGFMARLEPLFLYQLGPRTCSVTLIGTVIGLLITLFALVEIFSVSGRFHFNQRLLPLGGVLSGFFGGLSGHQGAFRSAFLIQGKFSKGAFIGTGVVCAILVDFVRISVYGSTFLKKYFENFQTLGEVKLLVVATLFAFNGFIHRVALAAQSFYERYSAPCGCSIAFSRGSHQ